VNTRFTIDGSDELESRLAKTCQQILTGVQKVVPSGELEALVLGGGYGRGQGGVLKTSSGEQPYNDLEFYVFIRGNVHVSERKYRGPLHDLGEKLSPDAGLHVEFKVYSVDKLVGAPVTMFTYDLVAGHKLIFGEESIFKDCPQHLAAAQIPQYEATRLLFNRCSGLLLAKNFLRDSELSADAQDFIGRNIAKAQLAFGDAVLTVNGRYHGSVLDRHERLKILPTSLAPSLSEILKHHADGMEFKLHPRKTAAAKAELAKLHGEVSTLGMRVWLWFESKRLAETFTDARLYAFAPASKCPESIAWRNALLNFRTFGAGACFGSQGRRYPRERLMRALALMLWTDLPAADSQHLKDLLRAQSAEWPDLIQAYQKIWQYYG